MPSEEACDSEAVVEKARWERNKSLREKGTTRSMRKTELQKCFNGGEIRERAEAQTTDTISEW